MARFNEYETLDPNGDMSPGSKITQGMEQDQEMELTTINDIDNPLMKNPIEIVTIKLPPKGKAIGINISRCEYHNLPYISRSTPSSSYYNSVKKHLRHNVWILAIGNNDPISPEQALKDLQNNQVDKRLNEIMLVLSKRGTEKQIRTSIGERWASFD